MTPLILASALLDGRELVEMILKHETDNINAVDDNGETALQCAVRSGCSGSVQKLLDHGADANQFTEEGTSILSLAVRHNELGSLYFLLNAGADVDALDQDPTGLSPLMHAIMRGNSLAHWTLLDHGASREVRDKTGRGVKELSLECNFTG
ncbi:hypothetical protein LMH87_000240 [Akanthomyces muscarius]|uniref:Ankyrin repeat protein n=1 Tax=Akanthomyces muscarius TaxID=2231603 RepID=A0A9W8UNM4_AKAMU|nr:hypothetical protein LMH87_000240 [Akanthomyces muscarius]KAJ4154970.1 hypothetical protein LMH87_000240 [Akanthomyces muscarius]